MKKKLIFLSLGIIFLIVAGLVFPIPIVGNDTVAQTVDGLAVVAIKAQEQTIELPGDVLVITNGAVIDGTGQEAISNGLVAIKGERIVAIGPATDFTVPAEAQVIDADGGTIMPGIINAHTHNTHSPGTRSRLLAAGVTASCDMATSLDDMAHFSQTKTEQGQAAARGFRSGPMITASEGYPSRHGIGWDYQVSSPQEAAAATDDLLDRGADMIKIALEPWLPHEPWPTLSPDQITAVVETAHARGVPVRAHIQQASMLEAALEAGVDAVEHVPLPFPEEVKLAQMGPETQLALADYPALEAQLVYMAQQRVTLVPTLNAGTCATHGMPELETPARKKMCDFQLRIVGRFHQMGGVVALGNDYGNPGVERGMPLQEMALLLEAGLTPMEVLRTGTRNAANVCGHGDELGTLEPGKLADLIIIDGDPLRDLNTLARVSLVIQGGRIAHHND